MADDAILAQRAQIEQEIAGRTVCDLLQDNADRHGEAPAASWRDGGTWHTLSWREYRQRVVEVAAGLASLGVDHGDFVALMMSNRPEHVIADQGAVHAGAVPTTLYATLAPEQIRYCAAHCAAKVAILEHRDLAKRWQELREGLPALQHVVVLEGAGELTGWEGLLGWDELLARGRDALAADPDLAGRLRGRVRPEDPVTLVYTSGTIGPPKGVILSHRNVLYECAALDRLTGLPDGIAGVSYLPLAHIAEPPRRRRRADAAIAAARQGVRRRQRGQALPLALRARHALLDRLVLAKIRAGLGMDRCRLVASAAAPLAVDLAESLAALGLPVVEVWGLTETTGAATGNPPDAIRIGTVGPPIAGIELKLADDGEVLVRGPITTPAYLGQPEATAELLDADGWLHTGDVGALDQAGHLRIIDRKKELIITAGGKNISPATIEALLKQHPLVGQALAFGDRRPYVVALIVLDHEVVAGWAGQHGIADASPAALAEHPLVVEEVAPAVAAANQRLAQVEQIKQFKLLPAESTAESEELTPTLKLKRRVIHGKYAPEIDTLYAAPPDRS